jgi:hypothetical protein
VARHPVTGDLQPPSGSPPPAEATLGSGPALRLRPLAEETCRRYSEEYPDEEERYGDAGVAWCIHDIQHLLSWGSAAVNGFLEMNVQVSWLAGVLEARSYPLDRLARGLDLASAVVHERVTGEVGRELAVVLSEAAQFVRSTRAGSPDPG